MSTPPSPAVNPGGPNIPFPGFPGPSLPPAMGAPNPTHPRQSASPPGTRPYERNGPERVHTRPRPGRRFFGAPPGRHNLHVPPASPTLPGGAIKIPGAEVIASALRALLSAG